MDLTLRVTGVEEISAALAKLPSTLQDRYGVRAMESAAEIVEMAVVSRVPTATGLARASIVKGRVKFYRQSGTLFIAIEPQKGFKRTVSFSFNRTGNAGKTKIHSRSVKGAAGDLSRVQDPRRYMHIIEKGRKAIVPTKRRALHSALDPQDRFFVRAAAVAPHPVFQPARDSVADAVRVMMEVELNRGVEEWTAQQAASAADN